MLALVLYVHSVLMSLFEQQEESFTELSGQRVCFVHPTIRERSSSVSSDASTQFDFRLLSSEESSSGEEESEEEAFVWRFHNGGGWNGWRSD